MPSIDIIDLDYPQWHTAQDDLDHVSARSLQIVGDVVLDALPANRDALLRSADSPDLPTANFQGASISLEVGGWELGLGSYRCVCGAGRRSTSSL